MAETQTLEAQSRERTGTGGARAVRREGKVPGILYGDGKDPTPIKLDPVDVLKAYRNESFMSSVLNLSVDGKDNQALPREVQTHPVRDHILHVDFMRVGPKTRVTVNVPVHFSNEEDSPGLKRGGVLNIVRHDIELRCPATAIPEFINGNLDGLDIGDSIKISSVNLPDGVAPTITDRDFTIATIAAPSIAEEPSAEDGEEGEEGVEGEAPTEGEAAAEGDTEASD